MVRTRITARSAAVSVAAILALAAAGSPAFAIDVPTPPPATITPKAGPVVFAGIVRDASGVPAVGADITLTALPTQAELESAEVGDTLGGAVIGSAVSSATGAYTLRTGTELATWQSSHPGAEWVNVDVIAATDNGVMVTATTLQLDSTGTNVASVDGVSVAAEPASLDFTLQPAEATAGTSGSGGATPAGAVRGYACMVYKQNLGKARTTLGSVRSRSTAIRASATYTASASNTFGAGLSTTGVKGTFSASGTITWSADTTLSFATQNVVGTQTYRTEMEYGLYYGTGCSPRGVYFYQVLPARWVGSAYTEWNSATPTIGSHCAGVTAGNGITKASGTNTTNTTGASTSGMIGINLSSKANWSSKFTQVIKRSTAGYICGTSGYPGESAPGYLGVA